MILRRHLPVPARRGAADASRPDAHFTKSFNAFSSNLNVSSKRSTSGDIFCQSKSNE
jgi:hypothetical protein